MNENLIGSLAHWLAAGKLDARSVLPALRELTQDPAQTSSLLSLLETFGDDTTEAGSSVAGNLRDTLRREALRFHDARKRGLGISDEERIILAGLNLEVASEWEFNSDVVALVTSAITSVRDLGFLASNQEKAPLLFREAGTRSAKSLLAAQLALASAIIKLPRQTFERLESSWPTDLPGRDAVLVQFREARAAMWRSFFGSGGPPIESPNTSQSESEADVLLAELHARFNSTLEKAQKAQLLDLMCAWPTPAAVRLLESAITETWARDRAVLNLTLRFGQPDLSSWDAWKIWMSNQARSLELEEAALARIIQGEPFGLLLIQYSQLPDPDPSVLDSLTRLVCESGPAIQPQDLVQRWSTWISIPERRALLGLPEPRHPPLPPIIPTTATAPPIIGTIETSAALRGSIPPSALEEQVRPSQAPASEIRSQPPVTPPTPPKPSVWEQHIQPFFVENWYIVAGIAMVILGSSLLAYYTWDKHWLVRYTIMPFLLACFTWSLAGAGGWIEKKGAEFKSTAAILRGAAIGLLPINFMAIALLSADNQVSQKGPALLAMALIYFAVFGWGLRNWCAAVEPGLGLLLGGTLLLLNALVAVGPLARTVGHLQGQPLLLSLGAGFYLGFLATAAAIVRFCHRVLTREMAEEKRVPWFLAATLALTFLQVFIWVHGFMRHLPRASTYALMTIGIGWLVLFVERRALQLRESPQLHAGESFLGFALLLVGLLMGFTEPTIRICSFAAAGLVWIYQAFSRGHELHYWIALTLWALGIASIGLLPEYPGPWLPLLGIAVAIGCGIGGTVSTRRAQVDLARACRGMQVVALVLTTMVAPLAQWHYRSAPIATAGWLVIAAGLFAWRAIKDQQLHWLHATMVVLALALPYAGLMDMANRTAHHNTMVFGLAVLSLLWLATCRACVHRSTSTHKAGDESPSPNKTPAVPLALEARSTILWFYGALAVAAMLLRVVLGDFAPIPLWFRDFMDYTGPMLMLLALVPATYHSRSLIPAGMAVLIMAILFPELRANLQASTPWLSWGTGLGSACCGLALVWLCFFLRGWSFLKALPEGDRFLGREPFPFQRLDHSLFTWPILAAVLFLLVKVDTWNLIRSLLAPGTPPKTAVGLGITGVAWTFLAIYHREHRTALVGIHLGWLTLLAGICLGYWREANDPNWTWPFLVTGLLLQVLYWLYKFRLEPAYPWAKALLTEPTRIVLLVGSSALAVVCIAFLLDGTPLPKVQWLGWFLAAQLVWHGLRTRHWVFGAILFFEVWIGLLAATAPGPGALWDRVSVEYGLSPTLWLLIAIQGIFVGLELVRRQQSLRILVERLLSILIAPFLIAGMFAVILALVGITDGIHSNAFSGGQQLLLLATLLFTARAHVSGFILLLAVLLGYVMVHRMSLTRLGNLSDQLLLLILPWRLALLGLVTVILTQCGRWVHRRKNNLLAGPFAQKFFSAPSCGWLFWPATIFCAAAAFYQTFDPVLREAPVQLWAPYVGVAVFALVASFWQQPAFFAGTGFLLPLGNIHLVRVFGGEMLRGHGLSELHLICLGIGLTLLQASALRRIVRAPQAISAINRVSLGLAGSILALLSANYFTEPNLATITWLRFVVSGTLAWLAGQYFRRASRHPGPGEEPHVDLCEAFYHFGMVLAIWCAALLIPWFRHPQFTLIALGFPVAYFCARAEFGFRRGLIEARRYRNSAAVLGFVLLGLYAFKAIFHIVLFPGTTIGTQYYHYNAPLILVLGLVLMRLHGLGGTSWLAFYGGVALMAGSYFLLTALPGFSPFDYPIPSAWCALALGHFWILTSYKRSPLRTAIQRLARLDDPAWNSLRQSWGFFLLAATHVSTLWGIADYSSDTYMVAPLLAGAASILVHQGIIRQSSLYLVAASLEFSVALHLDFLLPSYLPKDQVIWAILIIWFGLLIAYQCFSARILPEIIGRVALVLAALVFAQVLYHTPWSSAGLCAMAAAALLAAWTPQRSREPSNPLQKLCGAVLLWIPVWLVYFSQAPFETRGIAGAFDSWAILASTSTIFLLALFGGIFPVRLAAGYEASTRTQFRLFDSTLTGLKSTGPQIYRVALWFSLLVVAALQVLHYQTAFAPREIVLLLLLEAALAVAWFYEGRRRNSMASYYLMQIAAVTCFASLRRHLMLTTGFWTYEYDVWASLAFSFGLAGVKQVFDLQPRALRVPLLTTMLALPVMALVWVLVHGLGVNMALLVVGLHSVLFAYLGRGDRESPYNILALSGFVGFILLNFYFKLHLRAVHAYVIPTGLAVLVLQELFQKRIRPEARNGIRLITLMAMLGSSGYYALADPRHAITFNLTMVILSLLAMGVGSFLRIRLYLAMGFAGLMVDLVSILYKVLVLMERSVRMTVVGSLVLVIGAILVFGAIYYKTNKAALDGVVEKWRGKLTRWE